MGPFEPAVCTQGYYCPKNSKQQLKCPAGYFCPPGSEAAIRCGVGSHCPEGSVNEIVYTPFALLLVIDVVLLAIFLIFRPHKKRNCGFRSLIPFLPKQMRRKEFAERKSGYKSLDDDAEALPLESVWQPMKRQPTGFQAVLDQQYLEDRTGKQRIDIESNTELRHFVDSMKKAIQGSTFGLAIDFEDLKFHPKSSLKPILSQVSGNIKSGSLVGVMGGSGAGKCKCAAKPIIYKY